MYEEEVYSPLGSPRDVSAGRRDAYWERRSLTLPFHFSSICYCGTAFCTLLVGSITRDPEKHHICVEYRPCIHSGQ